MVKTVFYGYSNKVDIGKEPGFLYQYGLVLMKRILRSLQKEIVGFKEKVMIFNLKVC